MVVPSRSLGCGRTRRGPSGTGWVRVVPVGEMGLGVGDRLFGGVEQMIAVASDLIKDTSAGKDLARLCVQLRHDDKNIATSEAVDEGAHGCGARDIHDGNASHPKDNRADLSVHTEQLFHEPVSGTEKDRPFDTKDDEVIGTQGLWSADAGPMCRPLGTGKHAGVDL